MDRIVLALAFAASASLAAPALAQDDKNAPIVLKPSSQWNVDFADSKCQLARLFGEGENQHLLLFDVYGPQSYFGLSISGPAFERFGKHRETLLQFGDSEPPRKTWPALGTNSLYGSSLVYGSIAFRNLEEVRVTEAPKAIAKARKPDIDANEIQPLPSIDTDAANQIAHINLKQGGRTIRIETGNLGEPMRVLNQCAQDLLRHWGLDLDRHREGRRPPKWENALPLVRKIQQKYPIKALRKGEQGIFRMRLIIDESGKVTECEMENATVTEALTSPACEIMHEAKFLPALDKNGEPMKSYYLTSITYAIG